jgi:hypothetical protein
MHECTNARMTVAFLHCCISALVGALVHSCISAFVHFRVFYSNALCHTARPTKNGPRRSRYSDVCCVFLIDWTTADSG